MSQQTSAKHSTSAGASGTDGHSAGAGSAERVPPFLFPNVSSPRVLARPSLSGPAKPAASTHTSSLINQGRKLCLGDKIKLFATSPYTQTGGYVGYLTQPLGGHGLCVSIPPHAKDAGRFIVQTFTIISPFPELNARAQQGIREPVLYGARIVLVDEEGNVWNNKTGGLTGYIGPRARAQKGEMHVSFDAPGKGRVQVCVGDRIEVDVEDTHRRTKAYNKRLTVFKPRKGIFSAILGDKKVVKDKDVTTRERVVELEGDEGEAAEGCDAAGVEGDTGSVSGSMGGWERDKTDTKPRKDEKSLGNTFMSFFSRKHAAQAEDAEDADAVTGGYLVCDGRGETLSFIIHEAQQHSGSCRHPQSGCDACVCGNALLYDPANPNAAAALSALADPFAGHATQDAEPRSSSFFSRERADSTGSASSYAPSLGPSSPVLRSYAHPPSSADVASDSGSPMLRASTTSVASSTLGSPGLLGGVGAILRTNTTNTCVGASAGTGVGGAAGWRSTPATPMAANKQGLPEGGASVTVLDTCEDLGVCAPCADISSPLLPSIPSPAIVRTRTAASHDQASEEAAYAHAQLASDVGIGDGTGTSAVDCSHCGCSCGGPGTPGKRVDASAYARALSPGREDERLPELLVEQRRPLRKVASAASLSALPREPTPPEGECEAGRGSDDFSREGVVVSHHPHTARPARGGTEGTGPYAHLVNTRLLPAPSTTTIGNSGPAASTPSADADADAPVSKRSQAKMMIKNMFSKTKQRLFTRAAKQGSGKWKIPATLQRASSLPPQSSDEPVSPALEHAHTQSSLRMPAPALFPSEPVLARAAEPTAAARCGSVSVGMAPRGDAALSLTQISRAFPPHTPARPTSSDASALTSPSSPSSPTPTLKGRSVSVASVCGSQTAIHEEYFSDEHTNENACDVEHDADAVLACGLSHHAHHAHTQPAAHTLPFPYTLFSVNAVPVTLADASLLPLLLLTAAATAAALTPIPAPSLTLVLTCVLLHVAAHIATKLRAHTHPRPTTSHTAKDHATAHLPPTHVPASASLPVAASPIPYSHSYALPVSPTASLGATSSVDELPGPRTLPAGVHMGINTNTQPSPSAPTLAHLPTDMQCKLPPMLSAFAQGIHPLLFLTPTQALQLLRSPYHHANNPSFAVKPVPLNEDGYVDPELMSNGKVDPIYRIPDLTALEALRARMLSSEAVAALPPYEQACKRPQFAELLERVCADMPARMLEAEDGDEALAKQRWYDSVRWRQENGMNTLLITPYPQFEQVRTLCGHYFHKHDKFGHFVYIDRPGKLKLKELRKMGMDDNALQRHFLHNCEYQWAVLDATASGKVLSILDMSGLGFMEMMGGSTMGFVKKMSKVLQQYYPVRSFKIVIVNAPSWFNSLWKIISPMLHERTRAKTIVCGSDVAQMKETLLPLIDAASLPVEYGGTCACPGGCTNSELERGYWEFVRMVNQQGQ